MLILHLDGVNALDRNILSQQACALRYFPENIELGHRYFYLSGNLARSAIAAIVRIRVSMQPTTSRAMNPLGCTEEIIPPMIFLPITDLWIGNYRSKRLTVDFL